MTTKEAMAGTLIPKVEFLMKPHLFATVLALVCATFAHADKDANLFKMLKVGDYATFKINLQGEGKKTEGAFTMKVIAKDDKTLTLQVTTQAAGKETVGENKIDLTKPYSATAHYLRSLSKYGPATVEKRIATGKEKITVDGKEYQTTWETYITKRTFAKRDIAIELTIWQTDYIPFSLKMKVTTTVSTVEADGSKDAAKSIAITQMTKTNINMPATK